MIIQELREKTIPEHREVTGTAVTEATMQRLQPPFAMEAAPIPNPLPIPIPLPPIVGPRILIYKQDPTVAELGVRAIFIPSTVLNGPSDTRITTELPGTTPVARNINGDFIFTPNSPQFDCAHTYAVVRETLTMYQRHNDGAPIPFAWNTGGNLDRITVFPHASVGANAFYSRTAKALKFLFFTPTGSTDEVFTCRSLDIVAHETGHAILDGLKPGWLSAGNPPQTGGLHESFGDLTAIFLALSEPDQAEALVALTKANLHAKNFLSALAEQFGQALGLPFGLRNADNDLKLSEVGNEVHSISQVFTGGIYDVLADIYAFERATQGGVKSPTVILMDVAAKLCKLLFQAIKQAPATAATYTDVVNQMLQISAAQGDPNIYRTFIRNRFAFREVVTSPTPFTEMLSGEMDLMNADYTGDGKAAKDVTQVKVADAASASLRAVQDRSSCCGTMQMPEFQVIAPDKLASKGDLSNDDILATELAALKKAFK
ncbi:hypothetical protein [Nonomuraea sediminis]|uniref:hypothetical protein n=1 Tax=Nonomuraea sediminis TaxID=2835864 RepID=UPI001BDDB4B0|nr:hypothetical protein [Nonomuraea sediminis]